MIAFTCESCGQAYKVKDEFAGRQTKCKKCLAKIKIPELPVATEEEPDEYSEDDASVSTDSYGEDRSSLGDDFPAQLPPRKKSGPKSQGKSVESGPKARTSDRTASTFSLPALITIVALGFMIILNVVDWYFTVMYRNPELEETFHAIIATITSFRAGACVASELFGIVIIVRRLSTGQKLIYGLTWAGLCLQLTHLGTFLKMPADYVLYVLFLGILISRIVVLLCQYTEEMSLHFQQAGETQFPASIRLSRTCVGILIGLAILSPMLLVAGEHFHHLRLSYPGAAVPFGLLLVRIPILILCFRAVSSGSRTSTLICAVIIACLVVVDVLFGIASSGDLLGYESQVFLSAMATIGVFFLWSLMQSDAREYLRAPVDPETVRGFSLSPIVATVLTAAACCEGVWGIVFIYSYRQPAPNIALPSTEKFEQIGTALNAYVLQHKQFPYAQQTTGLSWRVHLLPFLGQESLYARFQLNEPWDSEHNKALLEEMPDLYRASKDPWDSTTTRFQLVTGPTADSGLIFSPEQTLAPNAIPDGAQNTMMMALTASDRGVPWTAPQDMLLKERTISQCIGPFDDAGLQFLTADGKYHHLQFGLPSAALAALTTVAGEEDVQMDKMTAFQGQKNDSNSDDPDSRYFGELENKAGEQYQKREKERFLKEQLAAKAAVQIRVEIPAESNLPGFARNFVLIHSDIYPPRVGIYMSQFDGRSYFMVMDRQLGESIEVELFPGTAESRKVAAKRKNEAVIVDEQIPPPVKWQWKRGQPARKAFGLTNSTNNNADVVLKFQEIPLPSPIPFANTGMVVLSENGSTIGVFEQQTLVDAERVQKNFGVSAAIFMMPPGNNKVAEGSADEGKKSLRFTVHLRQRFEIAKAPLSLYIGEVSPLAQFGKLPEDPEQKVSDKMTRLALTPDSSKQHPWEMHLEATVRTSGELNLKRSPLMCQVGWTGADGKEYLTPVTILGGEELTPDSLRYDPAALWEHFSESSSVTPAVMFESIATPDQP